MSDITVTIQTVSDIVIHTNADKLEIAKILGTQTIVPKGQYKVGDAVVYFPPDILLPAAVSSRWASSSTSSTRSVTGRRSPAGSGPAACAACQATASSFRSR